MKYENILVTKRGGYPEKSDLDKIHRVLTWAAEGLDNVSVSLVEMRSNIQFFDGIDTNTIHETLVKATADLISPESPDYQYMAGRLAMFATRKQAFGEYTPPTLFEHITKLTEKGKYDGAILSTYSKSEIDELDEYIDHSRDMDLAYAATQQMIGKYLLQDRVTKRLYESPQMLFMLVAMTGFISYPKETRLHYVKRMYDSLSKFEVSLPTPIMGGLRTPTKQYSSCVKIDCDDSLDSINASANAIVNYISQRAGIGINAGAIRALGSPIRNGEAVHTGVIPFYKHFQSAVKSCSQGALRGGAATLFYPIWHREVESLLVLKNNRGVEDNRVRHLDYGVQINKLIYQRFINGENITLFSPHDVPGLYDAFFADQEKFESLYLQYEKDDSIIKHSVPARELFSSLMNERASTGRIYIQNVDHCNTHSAFRPEVAPIRMSNLCVSGDTEILTKEFGYIDILSVCNILIHVWNGEEWSQTMPRQTALESELLLIETDNVKSIKCTPEHKFYTVSKDYKTINEVRAQNLLPGDKLIKCDFPLIEGNTNLDNAYTQGFFSADGCQLSPTTGVVYLYNQKIALESYITGNIISRYTQVTNNETNKCVTLRIRGLTNKYYVPDHTVTIKDRLEWLAGLLDGDGCVQRNQGNQSIVIANTDITFLYNVRKMLEVTGCTGRIILGQPAGPRLMPDGRGGKKLFNCNTTYRLIINSTDVQHLLNLGIRFHRLEVVKHEPNRNASGFTRVTAVTKLEFKEPTYCFTEEKRHMGVFNGLLTGQCMEITLPTKTVSIKDKEHGEIALCTLSAINLGNIETIKDIAPRADILVRFLDELLDYQDYPVYEAELAAKARRSLGIGVINYAYYLAKNFKSYDETALALTHDTFEAIQYYCLRTSVELAKEKGKCEWFNDTTYSEGKLPIDTYKKALDEVYPPSYKLDWEGLRQDILKYGLRNSTLTALMPSETSSQIANATNGIEPPRGLVSVKVSKDGIIKQVVPEVETYGPIYPLLWKLPNNTGYLQLVAIMQKFVDQSISANTNYDPSKFKDGKVPMSQLLKDLLTAYKLGIKTLYYHNTRDGADDTQNNVDDCAGGACKI